MCAQQRRTLLRADALSWQTATTAFGVETNGKQTNRPKRKTLPAQTFGICRARTCRARSQPWSEGGPSREGKAIRAVQHGREVAPRPTPTIKASGQRGIRSNGHRRSPACPSELSQELRPERFGFRALWMREAPLELNLCWREIAIVAKALADGRDMAEIGLMRDIAQRTLAVLANDRSSTTWSPSREAPENAPSS